MSKTGQLGLKGRFIPVIDGFIYETAPQGTAYFVTPEERARLVRQILTLMPVVILGTLALAALSALAISGSYSGLGRSFPALLAIALMAIGLLYLGLRWVLLAPARAFADQTQLSRAEIHTLRESYEASLPEPRD